MTTVTLLPSAIDPVNIGPNNLPAYKMLAVNNDLGINIMAFFVLPIKGGNSDLYLIGYAAEKNEYASHLPLVQKMINSFEIP
jgi:hypothetical protein